MLRPPLRLHRTRTPRLCPSSLPTPPARPPVQIRVVKLLNGPPEARRALLCMRLLAFFIAFQSTQSPTGASGGWLRLRRTAAPAASCCCCLGARLQSS